MTRGFSSQWRQRSGSEPGVPSVTSIVGRMPTAFPEVTKGEVPNGHFQCVLDMTRTSLGANNVSNPRSPALIFHLRCANWRRSLANLDIAVLGLSRTLARLSTHRVLSVCWLAGWLERGLCPNSIAAFHPRVLDSFSSSSVVSCALCQHASSNPTLTPL